MNAITPATSRSDAPITSVRRNQIGVLTKTYNTQTRAYAALFVALARRASWSE